MSLLLLQLSLCVLMSSQQFAAVGGLGVDNSVNKSTEQVLSELVMVVSQGSNRTEQMLNELATQLQAGITQLQSAVSELQSSNVQLQNDVKELKATIPGKGCPAGFTYIGSVNGCYKVVKRYMDWINAGSACQSLHSNAHLLVVNDAQEHLAVTSRSELTGCNYFWTAGYRSFGESTFMWNVTSSGGYNAVTAMSYSNWEPGEPNYDGVQACVYLYRPGNYRWVDTRCTFPMCPVCEVDL